MASTRREQEDVLSLSFTDVLTCVLGASVALFLIFVAIVKLTSSDATASGEQANEERKKARSIQEEMDKGFATASLRIVSKNKALIENLSLSVPTSAYEASGIREQYLAMQHAGIEHFGKFLHLDKGLSRNLSLYVDKPFIQGELIMQLIVGGLPRFCRFQVKPDNSNSRRLLVSLGKGFDYYFHFHGQTAHCSGAPY